jgi:hypothetical protein
VVALIAHRAGGGLTLSPYSSSVAGASKETARADWSRNTGHRKFKRMKTIRTNHRRKSVRLPTPDLFDWRSELDRCAADPYAVRSIARRFRLSRTAARIIAEVAGIGGGAQ